MPNLGEILKLSGGGNLSMGVGKHDEVCRGL
jgi:hypothetical protein